MALQELSDISGGLAADTSGTVKNQAASKIYVRPWVRMAIAVMLSTADSAGGQAEVDYEYVELPPAGGYNHKFTLYNDDNAGEIYFSCQEEAMEVVVDHDFGTQSSPDVRGVSTAWVLSNDIWGA